MMKITEMCRTRKGEATLPNHATVQIYSLTTTRKTIIVAMP
jgi:hypothetical protein